MRRTAGSAAGETGKALTDWGPIADRKEDDVRAMTAIIRYVFRLDPDSLPPEEFARLWREAEYIIKTFRLITKEA